MQLLEVIFQIWRCSRRELKRGGLYQVHDPAVQLSIVPYNVGNDFIQAPHDPVHTA